ALRPLAHDLSRVLSYRLLHDRLTEGCAIASSTIPSSPPRSASIPLSTSNCCINRRPPAPSAARRAYSLRRLSVRDCIRFATLTQPISRTKATAPSRG